MRKLFIILLIPFLSFNKKAKPLAVGITSRSGTASTSNASSYAMTAFTPAAQTLLVAFVYATGTVAASPTMTGGSLTWTREAVQIIGANELAIFWARVGGSPVSTAPTFDCTGDAGTGAIVSCIEISGYDALTRNPIKQSKLSTGTTTSTNPNITFTSALSTNNAYFVGWYGGLTAGVSTPPTSWSENIDLAYATPSANGATGYRAGGETTSGAFTFTAASSTWQIMGVEVYVDAAGPNHTNFFRLNNK
jgi:hypothetical protein